MPENQYGRTLREMLAAGETIMAPGAYEALSAKIAAKAGFSAGADILVIKAPQSIEELRLIPVPSAVDA